MWYFRALIVVGWMGLVLVHQPLVGVYVSDMLAFTHYESLPLLWLAFAAFLAIRSNGFTKITPVRSTLSCLLLMVDATLLLVALKLFSPWLAYVALAFGSLGLLILLEDRFTGRSLKLLSLLLIIGIRLPLRYDQELISFLQRRTSDVSSHLLNQIGILHYKGGNVIQIRDKLLFVEEACSGVQSLFTLISIVALLVVYFRRSWLHASILFASSIGLAFFMNTMRITTVAIAQAWWNVDLSTGWEHELVGYAALVVAFGMLMSVDQCLLFLLSPIQLYDEEAEVPSNPLAHFFDRYFAETPKSLTAAPETPTQVSAPRLRSLIPTYAGLTVLVMAGVYQMASVTFASTPTSATADIKSRAQRTAERSFPKETLPSNLEDWHVVNFESKEQERLAASRSSIWTLTNGTLHTEVSWNYPYSGWKRLQECYLSLGWTVVEENTIVDDDHREWMCFSLENTLGEYQEIAFLMIDRKGRTLKPPVQLWDRVSWLEHRRDQQDFSDSTYMLQVRTPSQFKLTSDLREEAQLIGCLAANHLISSLTRDKH